MSDAPRSATLRIGIDARDAYAPAPRGVGKALADALHALVATDRGGRFLLYRDEPMGGDRFAGGPWVREVVLRLRGHRFSLWERVGLPIRAALDGLDLFHAPFPLPLGWIPCRFAVTIHDLIPLIVDDGWPAAAIEEYRRICLRNAHRATMVVTVSEATKRDLMRELSIPGGKIRVVYWAPRPEYYGVPEEEVRRVRESYDVPRGHFVALGGASPRKNLPRLLEAFAALPDRTRDECPLVVGGLPDPARASLGALARSLGVGASVRLRGYLPEGDLPPLFAGAKALLYLSLYEGFGLPILEGMAAGTAVLASDRSAIPEIAGDAAAYADPEDTAGITAALRDLAEDETRRRDLAARGRDRARRFTWERTAQELMAAYRDAAG